MTTSIGCEFMKTGAYMKALFSKANHSSMFLDLYLVIQHLFNLSMMYRMTCFINHDDFTLRLEYVGFRTPAKILA